ncbi:MAG: GTPase HflX [Candidatus Omnitrophica bacterium]|nr:GTPase HflX [Candidatus Omnitrophota bacterium]
MEKALLVTVRIKYSKGQWDIEDIAHELEELVTTSGPEVIDNIHCSIEKPTPNFFIGSGKANELASLAQEEGADVVIFSCDLSGVQQRNLEEVIRIKTIDRTQLILDIFARHAKSPVGKTQVALAQLQYLSPRLIGKGLILSRTGGGIGTSGLGEQRLEIDRRIIRKKIDRLKADLKAYEYQRATQKKKRQDKPFPAVALVGYTNAGKSTLLNALTQAGQVVADSLFTTLDPLSRVLQLPGGEQIVLSDTVGFLNDLPHHLIEAFKATLEEVRDAQLLIHVLDVNHPRVYEHSKAVYDVLKQLGAHEKPIITALNKIDLLEDKTQLDRLIRDFPNPTPISAKFKQNFDLLFKEIEKNFTGSMVKLDIVIPHNRMDLVDLFYREGKVISIEYLQKGISIKLNLPKILAEKLAQKGIIKG